MILSNCSEIWVAEMDRKGRRLRLVIANQVGRLRLVIANPSIICLVPCELDTDEF